MELKELLFSLDERLVQHDNNRKEVQYKLQETCSRIIEEANLLEEKINEELRLSFNSTEEKILNLIDKLNNNEESDKKHLIKQAQEEHSIIVIYDIQQKVNADNFVDSYKLEISKQRNGFINVNENNVENIVNKLKDHLNKLQDSVDGIQNKLTEICTKRRNEADEMKKRINDELETSFIKEDSRIQEIASSLKEKSNDNDEEDIDEGLKTKAKLTLLLNQKYSLDNGRLIVIREASLKWVGFEERKPLNITPSITNRGEFSLSFTFFNDNETSVLKTVKTLFNVEIKIWDKSKNEKIDSKMITKEYVINEIQSLCFTEPFNPSTTYCLKMRIEHENLSSKWSDIFLFTTPEFKTCVWKECPDYVSKERKYSLDKNNPRVATNVSDGGWNSYCTIIGNTPLPSNKVTSWNIKILKSRIDKGNNIYIGVTPFDVKQKNFVNYYKCEWYFDCFNSTLSSGPPHYKEREYGLRKGMGEYVHTGDSVGVVMDTTKGKLSFILSRVNYGVAYEGIPLDKPLVPCVILGYKGDSIELDTTEAKENVDSSIPIPSNIVTKSDTWDSITLTWDSIEGASFYQIEVDENISGDIITLNTFIKINLLEETEHGFRIRVVRDNSVSEWSDAIKVKTIKAPDFSECVWKKCPDYVYWEKEYSVDEKDHRIASSTTYWEYCTIIGNTFIPLNKITSWSTKILKSRRGDGKDIYVGVAPFDIKQDEKDNYNKCGWYFDCYWSSLYSGPPHNYLNNKEYGPWKGKGREYVHTGGSVGVVMDTTKGELSFVLNDVNLGVAYKGISLDKPLVPCVILKWRGDSVEFVI